MRVLEWKDGKWTSLGEAKTPEDASLLAPHGTRVVQGLRPTGVEEDAFIIVESRTGSRS